MVIWKAAPEADFRAKIFLYNYTIRPNIPLKSIYLAINRSVFYCREVQPAEN